MTRFAPRQSPPVEWCRSCARPDEPGALLRVVPTDGAAAWCVHRPSVSARCFAVVPTADLAVIQEADPEAAVAFDHEHADAPGPRADGRSFSRGEWR